MAGADVGPAADREGSDGDGDGGDDPLFDPAGAARRMRWRQLFQHELMHFVRIVEGYLVTQVVAGCWHWLEAQVPKAQHVNELRRAHDEYLDKALSRAFLAQSPQVLGCIVSCYKNIHRFHAILEAHANARLPQHAFAQCVQQREQFQRSTRFLYSVLRRIETHSFSENTHVAELLVRLDYNGYYARGSA